MNHSGHWPHRLWHRIRARPRLAVSVAVGCAVFPLLPSALRPITRILVTWDIGAGLYLALAWTLIVRTPIERMRWYARLQDDGAAAVLFLTVAAAVASLVAIAVGLAGLKGLPPVVREARLAVAAVTFPVSWLLVHTAFALHYAHAYYMALGREATPPLQFPGDAPPLYLDFAYFALVLGMTSQTADVALASTRMRRLAMAHGAIAFVFNTTLLALTVNVAAGLLA